MPVVANGFIPEILEQHLDAVGSVWSRRRVALRSPDYTGHDLAELEDLIEAHFEGLVAAGDDAFPMLLDALRGDDSDHAFAAASALLRAATADGLAAVVEEFSNAKDRKLGALRDALAHGPASPVLAQLTALFDSASPNVSGAAGEVLAFQGGLSPSATQLERLIKNDDAAARASGWRIVAYCRSSLPDERYEAGLADDDETVLPAVRQAAAWNAAPAFFSLCRLVAAAPSADSLETLVTIAAIAPPTDYKAIEAIAASPAVGPDRFRVVGAFGHPYFIDHLIREIERTDSDAVPSAFAAFTKMTGETVKTADEARRAWRALAPQLAHAARICAGMDISGAVERSAFRRLDRESAWEFCLRARLTTGWPGTPATLEHFPQRG